MFCKWKKAVEKFCVFFVLKKPEGMTFQENDDIM